MRRRRRPTRTAGALQSPTSASCHIPPALRARHRALGAAHDLPSDVRQHVGTYSYLLASRRGGEALIIDPVLEKVDRYLQLLRELDLKLVKAVDTPRPDALLGLAPR